MTRKSSWPVFWVAFSAGVVATIIQFCVPPVLSVLQTHYDGSYAESGLLMSLFALATLISALPGGLFVQKYGVRLMGLIGLGVMFAGILVCFFAYDFAVLLLGRIVQGIGFGLISVAAPSAIGQFVAPQMMSIAMGIWSTWVPVGSLIMFLAAPTVVTNLQLGVYWVLLLVVIAAEFVVYAIWIPKSAVRSGPSTEHPSLKVSIKQELNNNSAWWIAGTFASFTFAFFAFNTWISAYFVQSSVMSLVEAAWVPSIVAFFTMASNLYSGWLLKRYGNRLLIFLLPPLLMALLWPLFLQHDIALIYMSAVILGAVSGVVPTIVFTSAPLFAKSRENIGIVMAIVALGENTGILIGPEVFGLMREFTGDFTASFWMCAIVGLFTVFSSVVIWRTGVFSSVQSSASADKSKSI